MSYGADVNHRRDNKSTPLFMVCCKGYASIVTMLLIRNADLNICQKDASPLFAACNNGCVDIVKTLVEHGALVNKCTDDQTSPLFIACQEGYESIVA
jgi:ankyrin repeat protein